MTKRAILTMLLYLVLSVIACSCHGKVDSEKYDGFIQPLSEDGYKIVQGKANVKIYVSRGRRRGGRGES